MILKEAPKNSHEKFAIDVVGETFRFATWKADGRGKFRPTKNAIWFDQKHMETVSALFAKSEGAK